MKKTTIVSIAVIFVLFPLTLFLGTKLSGRQYYITSSLIIIEMLSLFLVQFEGKKVGAREIVLIAVLSAIAIAARFVIPIPHFKPMFGVIMLSAIAFGPQTGFVIGAIAAFGSNFFAGQGAFTPWQMIAYGLSGFIAGLFCNIKKPFSLGLLGFLIYFLVVGPVLDLSTVFIGLSEPSLKGALAIFAAGLGFNITQSLCNFLVMFIIGRPFLYKLERIKNKYGILKK
jgi:energy-coupling factor transport system substrate-specific component